MEGVPKMEKIVIEHQNRDVRFFIEMLANVKSR